MTDRNPLDQMRVGVGAVAVAIASAIMETDPGFKERFARRLEEAYSALKDRPEMELGALETVSWTRELLTGFSIVSGQGEPLLRE